MALSDWWILIGQMGMPPGGGFGMGSVPAMGGMGIPGGMGSMSVPNFGGGGMPLGGGMPMF